MTYNLPLHPSCKYSYNYPSYKYLESDFSTNNLHCGWPLCDVMKIEYDSSSMVPKYRQSLRIHSFQHVELVVGLRSVTSPYLASHQTPLSKKRKTRRGWEQGSTLYNTIYTHDAPHWEAKPLPQSGREVYHLQVQLSLGELEDFAQGKWALSGCSCSATTSQILLQ